MSALLATMPAFLRRADASQVSTKNDLCREIIRILRRRKPELMRSAEIDGCSIRMGQRLVHLDNLALNVANLTPAAREEAVVQFFETGIAGSQRLLDTDGAPQSLDAIRSRLRPQIVSDDYVNITAADIFYRPFSNMASVAIVEDNGGMFRYLRADETTSWGASFSEVETIAISNLAQAFVDVPIDLPLEPGGVVAVLGVGDGYDAARMLVPDFRRKLLAKAGTALYAAIPTRDTLIVWTPGIRPFEAVTATVRELYDEGPYSRTYEIFSLTADAVRPL